MSSKTKIVVLKSKELIYTGIFIILGIMLILLLFYMFSPGDKESKHSVRSNAETEVSTSDIPQETTEALESSESTETFSGYIPGMYTSEVNLGGSTLLLTVSVDENRVTGVTMDNVDETLTAMYPLVQPSLDEINSQIGMVSSLEDITYSADNKYTTILILDAINQALESAKK